MTTVKKWCFVGALGVAVLASRWLFPKKDVAGEQRVSEQAAPANEQRELAEAA